METTTIEFNLIEKVRCCILGFMRQNQITYSEFREHQNKAFMLARASETDLKAKFDLALWQRHGRTNFTSRLYSLIDKADINNRELLRQGFPKHVQAFEEWQEAADGEIWIENALEEYSD